MSFEENEIKSGVFQNNQEHVVLTLIQFILHHSYGELNADWLTMSTDYVIELVIWSILKTQRHLSWLMQMTELCKELFNACHLLRDLSSKLIVIPALLDILQCWSLHVEFQN